MQRELARPGPAPSRRTIILIRPVIPFILIRPNKPNRPGLAEVLQSMSAWPPSLGLAVDGSAAAECSLPSSRYGRFAVAADSARSPALG